MQGGASRGQHRDQSISPNSQNDSSHRNPTFMTHTPQRKQEDLQDRVQELQDRQHELERCKAALLEANTATNGLQATPPQLRFRAKMQHFESFYICVPENLAQNLALTVLFVPSSFGKRSSRPALPPIFSR